MARNLKKFKRLAKGFGKSFVEMGGAIVMANTNIPEEQQVVLVAKLSIAEDLISDVCNCLINRSVAVTD